MKNVTKLLSAVLGLGLVLGGTAFALKQNKDDGFLKAEAATGDSYTMTAGELFGNKQIGYNDTYEVVGDVVRITSTAASQFNLLFQPNSNYNFYNLSYDCTSMTIKLKVSSAQTISSSMFVRYNDGTNKNYLAYTLDLAVASREFVDVTFNRPDGTFFDCFTFGCTAIGAYVDIKSVTFNGLTSFGTSAYSTINAYNNHYDNGNGTYRVLIDYAQDFGKTTASSINYVSQLAEKVTLNGQPLSSYSGTLFDHQHGGKHIQVVYKLADITPTAEYPVTTLEIKDGTFFENTILSGVKIVFNGTKWELDNFIADDPLVQDGDYKLFTFGDYNFSHNSSFIRFAPQETIDALNDSFGLRFIVNLPTGTLSSNAVINFGCTDIFGTSPFMKVHLNYSSNSYLTFNGNIDWSTNKSPVWTEDVDHLVEIYFIKTSASAANVLLGIDGNLIWKSASQDITSITIRNFLTITGTASTDTYYSDATDTTAKALNRFANNKLHAADVSYSNTSDTGACRGNNGYYNKAKAFYNAFLTSNQMIEFANGASYAQARDRFIAWGVANGEALSFNTTTGALVIASNYTPLAILKENINYVVVIALSLITISGFAIALMFIRKRKLQK